MHRYATLVSLLRHAVLAMGLLWLLLAVERIDPACLLHEKVPAPQAALMISAGHDHAGDCVDGDCVFGGHHCDGMSSCDAFMPMALPILLPAEVMHRALLTSAIRPDDPVFPPDPPPVRPTG